MHTVFVIPGIMGTELLLPDAGGHELVWPPTPLETQLGYKRTAKLASPALKPGRIIRKILCIEFYKPLFDLLTTLGFTPGGTQKRVCDFPYDWRRDLFDLATDLGTAVGEAVAAGATQVSLVAHSMGGLICRLLLEDKRFRKESWFGAIDQLIAIATPHYGAPLALARVLGRDSAMGISGADFAWLANQQAYPSAYQLLPAPGEGACWNQDDPLLRSIDIYDPAGIALLRLNPALIKRSRAVHDVLSAGNQPPDVRYFYFGATGHRTVTRINVFKQSNGSLAAERIVVTRTEGAGDGTVPLHSALPRPGQRQIVVNEHVTAFRGTPFRRAFLRLLGGTEGPALEAALVEGLPPQPKLALSVESPVVSTAQSIELLLYLDDPEDAGSGIEGLSGELAVKLVRQQNAVLQQEVRSIAIQYSGPALSRLRLYLKPFAEPGHYTVSFSGEAGEAEAAFSVCASQPMVESGVIVPSAEGDQSN